MNKIKKWLGDIFTEPGAENHVVCPVRVLAIIGSMQYLGLAIAKYVQHGEFDAQNYAIGFGALLGGVGVALGLKKDSPKS